MDNLIKSINESVRIIASHPSFIDWRDSQRLGPGDLIVINNSFVYRSVSTTKNDKYLGIRISDEGKFELKPIVAEINRVNSNFKKYSGRASNFPSTTSIEQEIENELSELGILVFILLSQIDDSVVLEENIYHQALDKVIWDPNQPESVRLDGDSVHAKDTNDEQAVWDVIVSYFNSREEDIPDGLREAVGIALDHLQENAVAKVRFPTTIDDIDLSMTGAINNVLVEQRQQYAEALGKCQGTQSKDPSAYNELLRIAYNFASDATTYLQLIVSICDLKPIILWGTIDKHFELSEAFKALPWTRSRNKPSFKNYITTISDARNSTFHNLFPFRKSLDVSLPSAALQNASLRIFSEHGKRKENQLIYQDKELVDVLVQFTRARDRRASPHFWKQNLKVMDATTQLFKSTEDFLKILLPLVN